MEVAANKQSKGYFSAEPLYGVGRSASATQLFDNEIEDTKCEKNGKSYHGRR